MCFRSIQDSFCSEPLSKSGQAHVCQLLSKWHFGLHQNQCTFQKIHSLSTGWAHSRVLAYIASPTSRPPYVGKQLTALFYPHPLLKYLLYSIVAPTVNCVFQLKPNPALQAPGHSSTRLDIWPQDLGLRNEYTLSYCGLFAASRHKLASTSRHYSLPKPTIC